MKIWEKLTHKQPKVVAEGLTEIIESLDNREKKKYSRVANRYYNAEHDILNSRIFYLDDNGILQEDEFAANVKLPHPYFMEQVDQKTQYLLANNVEFETENETLKKLLEEYINEDFNLFLDEMVEGASINGAEYAYARTNEKDRLMFQVSDFISTDTIFDDYNNEVAVVRRYNKIIFKDDKEVITTYAEVYREDDVVYLYREDSKAFGPDKSKQLNPQAHVIAYHLDDERLIERSYGRIPFYRLGNNRKETSDLVPIKALIDDYDRMASFLSNNLEDYDKPIYVVTGYRAQGADQLRQNIKAKGVINVGAPNQAGDVQVRTYQIPYEAREAKMKIDKEAIYKFGMAFDSSQTGDGNITNVVIKSRYSLLDLKCNKIEPRLRAMIRWCLELILEDIQRLGKGSFDVNDIEVNINRNMLFNEKDSKEQHLLEEQAKQALIQTIVMASPYLDDETVVKQICEALDLEFEEVIKAMDEEDIGTLEGDEDELEPLAT